MLSKLFKFGAAIVTIVLILVATIFSSSVTAAPVTRTLSTATADSTGTLGVKWRRISFNATQTGNATFRLTWTGNGDLRFQIQNSAGTNIGGNITAGGSPKTYSRALTAGTPYSASIWAYSGVGTYTFTITEEVPDVPTPTPTPTPILTPTPTPTDGAPTPTPTIDVTPTPTVMPATRPNVIVINTDDQRADTLQYLPKIKQWLADAGTTFTNAYVTSPTCCPSRSALMSGRYVHNNGQYQHLNIGVDLTRMTQRYLQDGGYFTGHAGKFIHWVPLSQVGPNWDRWTYFKGGYDNVWMRFDNVTKQSQGYSTVITFDRAIEYLNDFEQRDDNKPFYMQLAPVAPHSPSTPEPQYATATVPAQVLNPANDEADKTDKPPFVRNKNVTTAQTSGTRTAMIRTLYTVDDQVDRLMRALEEKGELDNTLIIYTSDNGYMWGEHKLNSKFLPYKEAVNVPMVIRWPGHVAAGATDTRMVAQIDILPTILAATGVTQSLATLDGHDILSGYNRPLALTEYYYDTGYNNGIPTWSAIRRNEYLYVEYYGNANATNTTPSYREYYDMVNDPYQLQNLLGDSTTSNDPNVAQLSSELNQAKTCVGSACQ